MHFGHIDEIHKKITANHRRFPQHTALAICGSNGKVIGDDNSTVPTEEREEKMGGGLQVNISSKTWAEARYAKHHLLNSNTSSTTTTTTTTEAIICIVMTPDGFQTAMPDAD